MGLSKERGKMKGLICNIRGILCVGTLGFQSLVLLENVICSVVKKLCEKSAIWSLLL